MLCNNQIKSSSGMIRRLNAGFYLLTTHPTNEYKCKDSKNMKEKQAKWKKWIRIETNLHISSDFSYKFGGNRQIWAKSKDISMLKCRILEASHIFAIANNNKVAVKNPIKIKEAPRVMMVAVVWKGVDVFVKFSFNYT